MPQNPWIWTQPQELLRKMDLLTDYLCYLLLLVLKLDNFTKTACLNFFSTNFFHNSINTELLFTPQPIMLLCSSLFVYNTKVISRKKGMKKWKEKWSEEAQKRRERVNHQWWTAFEEVNRKETTCWWWQRNMEETRKKVLLMETKGVWWWYFTCLKGFIDEGTTEKRKFLFFALIVQTKKDSHFHKHTTEIIERSLWSTIFKNQTIFTTAKRLFRWEAIVQRRSSMGKDGEGEVSFALWYCIGYPQTRAEHNQQAE